MKTLSEKQFNAINDQITNLGAVEQEKAIMRPFLDEIRKFIPDAAYYYRITDENHFIDIKVRFNRNGINFIIFVFDKHYYIVPDMSAFEYVDTRNGWPATKYGYKKPNKIGVLSARKVAEQIEYETAKYRYFEQINEERKRKIDQFLKSLEGENISWRHKNVGTIERNGVILKFDFSAGVIQTQIEIANPYSIGAEAFKNLADSRILAT